MSFKLKLKMKQVFCLSSAKQYATERVSTKVGAALGIQTWPMATRTMLVFHPRVN